MVSQLLETIATSLDGRGIPYMIIGGQAVLVHGEPRMTKDIDVTLGVSADSLEIILEMARALGWELLPEDPATFVKRTMVLPCRESTSGIRINMIFSFTPYEREAIERAVVRRVGSTDVKFASAENLIIHKICAGRPRDREDARTVLLKNPQIDREYIRSRLEQLASATHHDVMGMFEDIQASVYQE